MAINKPYDDNHRQGAVKDRSQSIIRIMIVGLSVT